MRKLLGLFLGFLVLNFNFCLAEETNSSEEESTKTVELKEIVVTPFRYEETSSNIPAKVSVITSDKIKDANYQNVLDAIEQESSLIVRDYYGTGHKASVDLRGFGETAGMNILVLIDGRRTNQIDLSGVDWKQIPIERIKRIEIIHGSGNVLYGDNASAGVINIITKTGKDKPELTFKSMGGSFQTRKNTLTYEGRMNSLAYSIGLISFSTNGYRQNSDYRNTDIGAKIIYDFDETLSLKLSGNYHNSDFGLPGALRTSQLKTYSRKKSLFPEDTVGNEDWYLQSEIKKDFLEWGKIKTSFSFRRRRVDNNLISSQSIDGRRIDTVGINAQYILESIILTKKNKFNLGIDYYNTNSIQDEYSGWGSIYYSGKKMRDTDIDKKSIGVYLQDTINLSDRLNFVGGYRYEQAKYTFDSSPKQGPWISDPYWSNTIVNDKLTVDEEALTLGLNYNLSKNTRFFFNHTRGFRFPATDEYYSLWGSPPVNTNLKPQTSKNYELGITTKFIKNIQLSLNLFNMHIENELY
jgi:iron complex outermembrane receptor protein